MSSALKIIALCAIFDNFNFFGASHFLNLPANAGSLDIRVSNRRILAIVNKQYFVKNNGIARFLLPDDFFYFYNLPHGNGVLLATGFNNGKFIAFFNFSIFLGATFALGDAATLTGVFFLVVVGICDIG